MNEGMNGAQCLHRGTGKTETRGPRWIQLLDHEREDGQSGMLINRELLGPGAATAEKLGAFRVLLVATVE